MKPRMRIVRWGRHATYVRSIRFGTAVTLAALATVFVGAAPAQADTVRGLSWHLRYLHIAEAQEISQGSGVVVAVIDSGVEASHPDLKGQVLSGIGLASDAAPDGRRDPDTEKGHGTGVASLIVGKGGGENRVLGIAPKAKILPISLGADTTADGAAEGLRWAVDHGATVVNVSLAHPGSAIKAEREAVEYALSKDVVVVAGAGNIAQSGSPVGAMANLPGVIAVSGIDQSGTFWSGSARGPEVVVAAPAVEIVLAAPTRVSESGYNLNNGTSFATPMVAGVAALIRSKYPEMSAANVVNRIIRTARDTGPAGRDNQYGFGILDPVKALTAEVTEVSSNPLVTSVAEPSATAQGNDSPADAGPAIVLTNWNWPRFALCVAVVVAVVVMIVLLSLRSSRRAAQRRAAMPQVLPIQAWPPGQQPPQGWPPGQQPPQGWPPGPQQTQGWPPAGQPPQRG